MKSMFSTLALAIVGLLLAFGSFAGNDHELTLETILASHEAPDGIVFEIVNRDKQYLNWALPEAERLSKQLRDRFPTLDIAIVSHGSEQFALTQTRLSSNPSLKQQLTSLVNADIQVHVCGTHAERKQVTAEEFSDLVDVAAEGPAQINDYIKLGYIRIRLVKP